MVPVPSLSRIREGKSKKYLDSKGYAIVRYGYRIGVAPEDWVDASKKRLLKSRVVVLPMSEAIDPSEATSEFFASHETGLKLNHPLIKMARAPARAGGQPGKRHARVKGLRYGERYRVYVGVEALEDGEVVTRIIGTKDVCERCDGYRGTGAGSARGG